MQTFKKPLLLALGFTLLIILIHLAFSYSEIDRDIIRTLRPIRDILFFPYVFINRNISEIYCFLAKFGIFDYGRCIAPGGWGIASIPDGPPSWFNNMVHVLSLVILVAYYTIVFKILFKLIKIRQSLLKK
jgi:hypothetical protein